MRLTEEEFTALQARMASNRARGRQHGRAQSIVAIDAQNAQQQPGIATGSTQTTPATSKHRNRKTLYQGLVFDSVKECTRWQELQLFERVGAIKDLRRQVSYDLYACNGERIARYVADAVYWSLELGCEVREDTKSPHTRRLPLYRLKFKLMRAQGQEITEV